MEADRALKYADYFQLAFNSLLHRRTRSLLTIIGIFIGIAAVVGLISIGQGLQTAVAGEFEKMGSDKITIIGGSGGIQSAVTSLVGNELTKTDVNNVEKVRGVKIAGGALMKGGTADFKGEKKSVLVMGMPTDTTQKIFEDMQQVNMAQGRKLKSTDSRKLIIGSYFADGLYKKKLGVGSVVKINDVDFEVVGVLESMGNKIDDSIAIMTLDDARKLFNDPESVTRILVQTQTGADPNAVASRIEDKLRKTRHEDKGEETFTVYTSEQLLQSFNAILGVVEAMVVGIAAISLLVGGIGIMNTMYTSVVERTREIGIMKAIGARNGDILAIFLIESGLLGAVGGIVGILIGMGLGKLTEIIAQKAMNSDLLTAQFTPELLIGALLFSFVIGAASGTLPARQAASLKPVDALRYE